MLNILPSIIVFSDLVEFATVGSAAKSITLFSLNNFTADLGEKGISLQLEEKPWHIT